MNVLTICHWNLTRKVSLLRLREIKLALGTHITLGPGKPELEKQVHHLLV